MRRIAFVLVGFLALAGVIGYLATGGIGNLGSDSATSAGGVTGGAGEGPVAVPADGMDLGFDEGAVTGESDAGRAATGGSVVELPGLPEIGPAVIRTARLSIEVREGGFGQAFDSATLVAGQFGGYVQSSSMAGTDVRSGDLLIRVPADRFDEALAELRRLGSVKRQSISGQDVSAQFVDLEARLRTWQSQEAVLLDLMGQATTIEATIRVQNELQDVQFRIEQIQGQLNLLEDQTALATIQVSLREPGAAALDPGESPRPSLAEAWRKAIDGFLGVCFAVVVGLGYLIPLTALAALAWLVYRRFGSPRPEAPTP